MPEAILICGGRERTRVQTSELLSIREFAARLHPGSEDFLAPTIAIVGGEPVLRENWSQALAPSAVILFIELPMGGGGGSNPLTAILGIVAAIAIPTIGGWVAGSLLELAKGTLAYNVAFGVTAGVLALGFGAIAGALCGATHLPSGLSGANDAASASPTYNVNSSGNQARLYQPEPEGFGRMKIVPDYIASPWVQYIENEQFGYFVYALGRGSYDVESMSFGDTVFWRKNGGVDSAYDNVQVQFVEAGDKVTLFPDNVISSSEVSGQELYGPNETEYKGELGPYVCNPPGTITNQIQLDIVLPQGIGKYDNNANLKNYSITIKTDYRRIDDFGNAQSEWATLKTETFSGATLTPQRRTLLCDVAEGRYEVKMVRTTDSPSNGRTMDTIQWSAMRAMLPGSLSYGVSAVAVKIRATNTLSNNASSKFSIIATRKLPIYDRAKKTWSAPVATRSWAAAVSAVCRESWGGGLKDRELDLDALWTIDEAMQKRSWYYDAYIDGAYTIWQLITEMCQPMLCVPRMDGAILSFVEDKCERPARYMLTPRNIRRGSFQLTFNTWSSGTPDDVVMNYLDSGFGFQQRDVKAVLPESESLEESRLEMLGITDREHAFRVAVGYAARNRWRRIGVECKVEGLGRLMNRGDVVTVAHPRLRDTASGKVDGWEEDSLSLTLRKDNGVVPESGDLYIAFSKPDGSLWGPCKIGRHSENGGAIAITLDAEDYATLVLSEQDVPWRWLATGDDSLPTIWTLQSARTFKRRMLVQSVSPSDLWTYTVNMVNDDERAYGYTELPVPAWESRGQLPDVDFLNVPSGLVVTVGGTLDAPILNVSWQTVTGADSYEVEVSYDGKAWTRTGRVNINRASVPVEPGNVWLRISAMRDALQSSWNTWHSDTRILPPAAVEATAEFQGAELRVSWQELANASCSINIMADEAKVLSVTGVGDTGYKLSVADAANIGGPWRELSIEIWAVNSVGPGPVSTLTASANVPAPVEQAETEIGTTSITLKSVTCSSAGNGTGYVLLQGRTPDFTAFGVSAMYTIENLPYTLSNLSPATTYYFRLAVKDAWFDDVPTSYASLNYSEVLPVTTLAEEV